MGGKTYRVGGAVRLLVDGARRLQQRGRLLQPPRRRQQRSQVVQRRRVVRVPASLARVTTTSPRVKWRSSRETLARKKLLSSPLRRVARVVTVESCLHETVSAVRCLLGIAPTARRKASDRATGNSRRNGGGCFSDVSHTHGRTAHAHTPCVQCYTPPTRTYTGIWCLEGQSDPMGEERHSPSPDGALAERQRAPQRRLRVRVAPLLRQQRRQVVQRHTQVRARTAAAAAAARPPRPPRP